MSATQQSQSDATLTKADASIQAFAQVIKIPLRSLQQTDLIRYGSHLTNIANALSQCPKTSWDAEQESRWKAVLRSLHAWLSTYLEGLEAKQESFKSSKASDGLSQQADTIEPKALHKSVAVLKVYLDRIVVMHHTLECEAGVYALALARSKVQQKSAKSTSPARTSS